MAIDDPYDARGSAAARAKGGSPLPLLALASVAAASACSLVTPFELRGARDGGQVGDADASLDGGALDGDGEGDADAEGDGGPAGAGPLTFVVSDNVLLGERVFDLDGDGTRDDAIADLGEAESVALVGVLNVLFGRAVERTNPRIFHFPWLLDRSSLTEEDALLIFLIGSDVDTPVDPSDDLSGSEPFHADPETLDACGEPTEVFADISMRGGVLDGSARTVTFRLSEGQSLRFHDVQAEGTIAPDASSMELTFAGRLLTAELGAIHNADFIGDLSFLELFLSGGRFFGLPGLPGITPDIDVDGDGLETFMVSEASEIERCIDGDRTVIEGRDCWQDPRIADAFALTVGSASVSAVFAGRLPGWQDQVEGTCPAPPEQSLFDPPLEE